MKSTKAYEVIKYGFKIIAFIFILAVCTHYVAMTLKDKGNYLKYEEFYQEEEAFDVLFFGSSRMLDGVHPMELWDEYGLTAYNMAQHSEGLRVSYWQMKNAFAHNKPKVAVVDVSLLHGGKINDTESDAKSYLHKSFDHIPFGRLKYEALLDTTEGVDLWEYLCPFSMYHNRWNELERMDFYMELPRRKGAESRVAIQELGTSEWSSQRISADVDTEDIRLDAIVNLCQENNVQLVLTCMPAILVRIDEDSCAKMNFIQSYADKCSIPFLNFAKDDSVINYATDFHDFSHLNPAGAKKVTNAVGAFLTEKYEFEPKSENTIKEWQQAYKDYLGAKLGELIIEANAQNYANYMLLLDDNDYVYETSEVTGEITVYLKETGEHFHTAQFQK